MFAYCGNNPIIYKDEGGATPICIVTGVHTKIVSENGDSVDYTTTIRYLLWDPSLCVPFHRTAVFNYNIFSSGIVTYDNHQEDSLSLLEPAISSALAKEMTNQARNLTPNALEGRSLQGLTFELQAHLLFSILGLLSANSDTTEMGSTTEGEGYDYNADWFEHPLRNLKNIFNAFFN